MILSDISQYLRERGQASLADIAHRFDVAPDAMRDMLSVLVRKKRIHRVPTVTGCGSSCQQCDSAATELYAWGEALPDTGEQAACWSS